MTYFELFLITVFLVNLFFLSWVYVLYGAFIGSLRKRFRPLRKGSYRPTISIIIPAHNEEKIIERKILNTLLFEYPKDKLEIIVVDDGSSDSTYEIAKRFDETIVLKTPRGGKNKAINAGLRIARGEVIVQTDADCFSTRKDALLKISQNFFDQSVGAVTSGVKFISSDSEFVSQFLNGYRTSRQKTWMWESQLDSVSSGLGVFLAFRRKLVPAIHDKCLADDVDISLQVRAQGFRVVYEPALEMETASPNSISVWYKQYLRRTLSGLVTLIEHKTMLFKWQLGWFGLVILPSRSLLIHLTPIFCLGCLLSSLLLNPLLSLGLTMAVLIAGIFSFLVRKLLIVQVVQVHAWIDYLLGRVGPEYWMKEPRH